MSTRTTLRLNAALVAAAILTPIAFVSAGAWAVLDARTTAAEVAAATVTR